MAPQRKNRLENLQLRLRSNVLERRDRSLLAASDWISCQDHSDSLPKLPKSKGSPPNPAKVIFTAAAPAGKTTAPVANSAPEQKPGARRQHASVIFAKLFGHGA
jgi:hypothetical protein